MRYRAFIVALLALCMGLLTACAGEVTATSGVPLTYDQIRNTGLANNCPRLEKITRGSIPIDSDKSYRIIEMCIQPTNFFVKEEPANKRQKAEYVAAKLLTRKTSSLDQISGPLNIDAEGTLTFVEKDGIDFQPITVLLPGGEEVPFLFTVKQLVAKSLPGFDSVTTSTDFEGKFRVPSYRGAVFLDPKGRGVSAGYDNSVALPSQADSSDFANVKRIPPGEGIIAFQVAKVDSDTGEIAGTFESEQTSDTDLGADEPEEVKIQGIFYAIVEEAY
ncbi:MAG: Photosystem II manganese-stabilizing polypeptide [Symploca sp. SIO3E6]|nr:Photosystem II manganese-stabilizing polypeptide [Caldora sp. SIO3E6]